VTSAETTAKNAASTVKNVAKAQETVLEAVATQAQRAVLIPVGATLVARDNVVETVKPYVKRTTRSREVTKNIKRSERRGTTARNQLERQLKRTRTQLERSLRQRRVKVNGLVKRNSRNLETTVKGATRDFRAGEFQRGVERVQTGVTKTAEDVRNQVPNLV
jgi:predicted transcriptional regulator